MSVQEKQGFAGAPKPAEKIDTVIIGGGQSGLAMSYLLTQQGREHVVLEKSERIGESWRRRWDSFTLVTPNWLLRLPGHPYEGDDPDGFLSREEVVAYLEACAARFEPPLRFGVAVTAVEQKADESGYLVQTTARDYDAANVVVAAGTFQRPRIPGYSDNVAEEIVQLHSSEYRNPQALPEGAVLVVGSGQSGCQIAQELNESGRQVYLCVGSAVRIPRRYRGRDVMWWADKLGLFDRPVEKLSSPAERFKANPQVSGKDGGRDINLHQFAREGIVLLGRLQGADGSRLSLASDLHDNLAAADKEAAGLREAVDEYVEKAGLDVPEEEVSEPEDGYEQEEVTTLDLKEAGVKSILWATGFRWDYSWVWLPIFDEYGYPVQERGVTACPGLYFLGLHWLHTLKSGLFYGVGKDAAHIANHMDDPVLE